MATSEDGAYPSGADFKGEIAGQPPLMVVGPDSAELDSSPRFYRVRAERIPEP
jgi:hypothetical protein